MYNKEWMAYAEVNMFLKLRFSLTRVSLTDSGTLTSVDHISVICGSIWKFFLRFCYLEFVKEDISDGFMAHSRVVKGGGVLLESLSFFAPGGPCFYKVKYDF